MKNIEERIKKILVERGWDDLRPSDLAKSIMIEGAELLEHFQWENPSLAEVKARKEKVARIEKELADVLIYAIQMSVLLDIDTARIIHEKLDHVEKKYPAELMRKNAKEGAGSGADDAYWQIKEKYRRGEV